MTDGPTVLAVQAASIVTEDLVRRATQRDSQHCMIAEAIKRGDPDNIRNVWVDLQTIRWSDRKKGVRLVALTPPEAANALVSFDRGEPLEPFSSRARSSKRLA
jgi:hypothetical protein